MGEVGEFTTDDETVTGDCFVLKPPITSAVCVDYLCAKG